MITHFVACADHDAAHPLGFKRDPIGADVFFDGDPRQQLARAFVGGGTGNPLGLDLDGAAVDRLHIDTAVGVGDPYFTAGGERIGARPLVGRPAREIAERHIACGERPGKQHRHGAGGKTSDAGRGR